MVQKRHRHLVQCALKALGIDNLVLAIHEASLPGEPLDDAGRGSACSGGGAKFFELAHALGFNAIQLGPSGQTSESNASPYDGTAFSRNILSIALRELTEPGPWGKLLDARTLDDIAHARPAREDRIHHRYALAAQRRALNAAFVRFEASKNTELSARHAAFKAKHAMWLEREALYDALCIEHGAPYFRAWTQDSAPHPDQDLFGLLGSQTEKWRQERRRMLVSQYEKRMNQHAFLQLVAHEQHNTLRKRLADLELKLFGDLQVGLSAHDTWGFGSTFLKDYRMGAPPSRTNPEGQPWGYPVLDPDQYHEDHHLDRPGPALRLLTARMNKMFEEFDGVRIDHPHGWVCPWVYHASDPDPMHAVRSGARLFSSPNLADHPKLAHFSIVSPDQLQPGAERHADGWVKDLSSEQIQRYGALFDVIVQCAEQHGRSPSLLVCEVLSTMPYPLGRVLAQHGLGRFRVVQKANLDDPGDPYRTENALPEDWVMLGTHDTKPAFLVAQSWAGTPLFARWARHLAMRLSNSENGAGILADSIEREGAGALVHALFADLCASRARNVMVFFSDLFGLLDIYNTPGTISEENWSLRLTPDFVQRYFNKLARGEALNLPRALAMALHARNGDVHRELIQALSKLSRELEGDRASSAVS